MNIKKSLAAAALAIGLAGIPLMAQGPHGRAGMHGGMGFAAGGFGSGRMLDRMAVVLDLTEAQKASAQKIAEDTRAKAKPLVEELRQSRTELAAAVKENNTGSISNITTRQGNTMGQLAALQAKAMADFYAQLTPDQKAKADKLHEQRKANKSGFRERLQNRRAPQNEAK